MTQSIPLTQGEIALVDDDDFDRVMQFKWHLMRTGRGDYPYAARNSRVDEGQPKRKIYLHRFILDAGPTEQVDHADGNTLDCRRTNIRLCTPAQNTANSRRENGMSGFRGVRRTPNGSYFAQVSGQFLGCYATAEDAARAFDRANVAKHGDFARMNFPDDSVTGPSNRLHRSHHLKGKPGPKYRARLTPEQVVEIRCRYDPKKANGTELAREFGVCSATVYHLLSGRNWKDVPASPSETAAD